MYVCGNRKLDVGEFSALSCRSPSIPNLFMVRRFSPRAWQRELSTALIFHSEPNVDRAKIFCGSIGLAFTFLSLGSNDLWKDEIDLARAAFRLADHGAAM